MDNNVYNCCNELLERGGILKAKGILLAIVFMFAISSAFAGNTSSLNITNVSATLESFTDIFGSDTADGFSFVGVGILLLFALGCFWTGMNPVVALTLITPLVIILATIGWLPAFLTPFILIAVALTWGIILIRMFGVR